MARVMEMVRHGGLKSPCPPEGRVGSNPTPGMADRAGVAHLAPQLETAARRSGEPRATVFGSVGSGNSRTVRFLYIPISLATSILGGAVGRWLFSQVWEAFDDQEPPQAAHLRTTWTKVIISAALRGAVFAGVRAAVDRSSRLAFMNVTGSWPGELEPDPD